MRIVNWARASERERKESLSRPKAQLFQRADVMTIIEAVRKDGDQALRAYGRVFDGCEIGDFAVSAAVDGFLSPAMADAVEKASDNLLSYHRPQVRDSYTVEVMAGITVSRELRPIERVGFYIPAGSAPLISTLLMLSVPAQLAGCRDIVLCTPPQRNGEINPDVLAVARACGISRIFRVGGAQAIAAMAFGTETVPKVDKIFGPGNSWVTEAKRLVSIDSEGAAIDMAAGPSEVMVLADWTADPIFVASDLLSQAEHGPDSQVILVSLDPDLPARVMAAMRTLMKRLGRIDIMKNSLEHAICFLVADASEALSIINRYAPEHLLLQVEDPARWVPRIQNAGSIFCGPYSPESAGDYASGSNHVLPTGGVARSAGGLTVASFQKTISIQTVTREGLEALAPVIGTLAAAEGLDAHALAVTVRLENEIAGERKREVGDA